ncbi:ABC-type transport system permease protein (probable substrate sugar) (plasmid) [Halobacterium hubeiense]|uniref:ABC-type transport system permease protein (Probable substrate sugar) n=1 Tax=Halobacterium hubeiense TaxID=1407499 RepID=A0A0U5D1K3_9EURY|nr:sugar ABC transporter permease [Halobacterium hubeiense]CQH63190.1 ABC-type transport system permease protein (probable substrate sugar) [Halobacterium hubeiense]
MSTQHANEDAETPTEETVGWRTKLRYILNSDFVRSAPYWGIPFLLMGIAVYGGIGYNLAISFTDYAGLSRPTFGSFDFEMYRRALGNEAFRRAAINNFVLLVSFTGVSLGLGLFLAVLLDHGIRFKEKVQTVYLLPMALSFVVTAQLWLWMYNQENGVLTVIMEAFGLEPINWLGNPDVALAAVIFALVWQFSGYAMVVYLAGLQSIPADQFEAAKVDGAGTLRTYARIIIPQLKESSVSAAVVLMVFALKAFTFLYALVGQYRPPNGTDILATLMVRQAFKFGKWAYGAAIATMLLLLALGVIAPYLYYQHRKGSL